MPHLFSGLNLMRNIFQRQVALGKVTMPDATVN